MTVGSVSPSVALVAAMDPSCRRTGRQDDVGQVLSLIRSRRAALERGVHPSLENLDKSTVYAIDPFLVNTPDAKRFKKRVGLIM